MFGVTVSTGAGKPSTSTDGSCQLVVGRAVTARHPSPVTLSSGFTCPDQGYRSRDENATADEGPAEDFIRRYGKTYHLGSDVDGSVAVDYGLYGVPETFFISKQGQVAYKHIGPVTAEILTEWIDKLLAEGDSTQNSEVKGGDVVYVPRADEVYVLGEVKNPGAVKFEAGLTLTQAISKVAGFTRTASKRGVQVELAHAQDLPD